MDNNQVSMHDKSGVLRGVAEQLLRETRRASSRAVLSSRWVAAAAGMQVVTDGRRTANRCDARLA